MREFPKWLLALAFLCLVPVFLSVFFLFGGVHPFGRAGGGLSGVALYFLTQFLWVLPVVAFFLGLDRWRRGYERLGLCILLAGLALTIADVFLLFG